MHALHVVDVTLAMLLQHSRSMSEAIALAERLADSGKLDVLDVGDSTASPDLVPCVQQIACELEDIALAARVPMHLPSIQAAWAAIRDAEHPMLQIVVTLAGRRGASSRGEDHQNVLLELVRASATAARAHCPCVAVIVQDAATCEPERLIQVIETAIAAGAETITLPETTGQLPPQAYGSLFSLARSRVRGSERILWGAPASNRFGGGAATTISALEAGARLITVEDEQDGSGNHPTRAEIECLLHACPEVFSPRFLSR